MVHKSEVHTIALGLISALAPVHQGAPTLEDEKKLLHVINTIFNIVGSLKKLLQHMCTKVHRKVLWRTKVILKAATQSDLLIILHEVTLL